MRVEDLDSGEVLRVASVTTTSGGGIHIARRVHNRRSHPYHLRRLSSARPSAEELLYPIESNPNLIVEEVSTAYHQVRASASVYKDMYRTPPPPSQCVSNPYFPNEGVMILQST